MRAPVSRPSVPFALLRRPRQRLAELELGHGRSLQHDRGPWWHHRHQGHRGRHAGPRAGAPRARYFSLRKRHLLDSWRHHRWPDLAGARHPRLGCPTARRFARAYRRHLDSGHPFPRLTRRRQLHRLRRPLDSEFRQRRHRHILHRRRRADLPRRPCVDRPLCRCRRCPSDARFAHVRDQPCHVGPARLRRSNWSPSPGAPVWRAAFPGRQPVRRLRLADQPPRLRQPQLDLVEPRRRLCRRGRRAGRGCLRDRELRQRYARAGRRVGRLPQRRSGQHPGARHRFPRPRLEDRRLLGLHPCRRAAGDRRWLQLSARLAPRALWLQVLGSRQRVLRYLGKRPARCRRQRSLRQGTRPGHLCGRVPAVRRQDEGRRSHDLHRRRHHRRARRLRADRHHACDQPRRRQHSHRLDLRVARQAQGSRRHPRFRRLPLLRAESRH
ncbi:MAG: hypothetical protein BWX86_01337 [Verrucomicrobia bacterium ADurb.Bin122]|nr:MAG: hypothetical protein BWX86_01337 [Verrucomicrobia bacterium ADurb.Bin122]